MRHKTNKTLYICGSNREVASLGAAITEAFKFNDNLFDAVERRNSRFIHI